MLLLVTALLTCSQTNEVPIIPDSMKVVLYRLINRQLIIQIDIERHIAAMQKYCHDNGADFKVTPEGDSQCVSRIVVTK